MSKCIEQFTAKYTKRGSPPYPAMDCKNRVMLGNDENVYKSKPDKNGTYKWIKTSNRSRRSRKTSGKSRSRRSRKTSRKSRSRKSRSRKSRSRKSRSRKSKRSRKTSRKSRSRKSRSRKSRKSRFRKSKRSRKTSRKSRSRKSRSRRSRKTSRKSRSVKRSRKSKKNSRKSRMSKDGNSIPDFAMFTKQGNNKVFKIVQEAIKERTGFNDRFRYAWDKILDLPYKEAKDSIVRDLVADYIDDLNPRKKKKTFGKINLHLWR